MGVGLLVGVWLARYLGPDQFGQLNYAIAFVGLFGALGSLGLNEIVVRDVVRDPVTANTTLGTAFALQVFGSAITLVLIFCTAVWLHPHDASITLMAGLLGIALLFRCTDVIKYSYESQIRSRYSVWVENISFLSASAIKIALILLSAPLIAFVWIILLEAVLIALGLMISYAISDKTILSWRIDTKKAARLLGESWPIVLSGSLVLVNLNLDKLMLGQMKDNQQVGIYSAAMRLVELWYFLPIIVGATIAPALTESFLADRTRYQTLARTTFKSLYSFALPVCILLSLLSDQIIVVLYGHSYPGAQHVLSVGIWASLFVFHVSIRTRLLIIEGKAIYVLVLSALATCTNFLLNFLLIPDYGATGAAYAYLISWMMSAAIFPLFFASTRSYVTDMAKYGQSFRTGT